MPGTRTAGYWLRTHRAGLPDATGVRGQARSDSRDCNGFPTPHHVHARRWNS